jgi:hypothetical protein
MDVSTAHMDYALLMIVIMIISYLWGMDSLHVLLHRYKCWNCSETKSKTCKHSTFNAYDEEVINNLPAAIRNQLPFVNTKNGAMFQMDVDLLDRDLTNGKSIRDFNETIREVNQKRYPRLHHLI